jgi:hypothetical protein
MIKTTASLSALFTTIAAVFLLYTHDVAQARDCIAGGLLMSGNLLLISWSIGKIFQKKSLALVSAVIVSKYAALIGLFFWLFAGGWRVDLGFAIGFSSLLPTALYVSIRTNKN